MFKKLLSMVLVSILVISMGINAFATETGKIENFSIERTNNPNMIKVIDGDQINYVEVIKEGESVIKSENMELLYTVKAFNNKILLEDKKLKQTSIIGTFSENIQDKNMCSNSKANHPIGPDPTDWRLMNEIHGSTKIDKANNVIIIAVLGALVGGPIGGKVGGIVSAIYNRINAGQEDFYYKKRWYERNTGGYDKEYKKNLYMYADASHSNFLGLVTSYSK